jgi:hypothetical protein
LTWVLLVLLHVLLLLLRVRRQGFTVLLLLLAGWLVSTINRLLHGCWLYLGKLLKPGLTGLLPVALVLLPWR